MPIGLELGSAWIFFGITHPEYENNQAKWIGFIKPLQHKLFLLTIERRLRVRTYSRVLGYRADE